MQLPEGFIEMVRQYPQLCLLEDALTTDPETSIRVNPAKWHLPLACQHSDHVPWCRDGIYLSTRPAFTFDPALHQGLYYVQDASSMAITSVISSITRQDRPVRYLDACAAPGGKTTAAISALPKGSVVVANEYDFKRAEILAENVAKWGYPNVAVTRGDTGKFRKLKGYFDIIAVDAPCSGEGMMRKDNQAISQWSPTLINQCALTQRDIISNVWEALRPGGYLIYSTCTFNLTEDEDNVAWIVDNFDAKPVEIPVLDKCVEIERGIGTPYPCYRFIPGRVRGEGLFMCVFRKGGDAAATYIRAKSVKPNPKLKEVYGWFDVPVDLFEKGDMVYALPQADSALLLDLASKLDTLSLGVETAVVKGKDVIPSHQLALSEILRKDAFVSCEVDYTTAIKYLQKEAIALDTDVSKGYILLTYKSIPLGFVKNLGNRSNNLLPKQWRILSKQIPDTPVDVLGL